MIPIDMLNRTIWRNYMFVLFVGTCTLTNLGCRASNQEMGAFADKLNESGICTEDNYSHLKEAISQREIADGFGMLKYCDRGRIIELGEYSDDPKVYLEQIHRDVATLMPELSFSEFGFEIVLDMEDSMSNFKLYKVVVSLKSNGRIYRQSSFFKPDFAKNQDGMMKYFGKIDQQTFYSIFNKVLADLQSPYRLHEVKSFHQNLMFTSADYARFGIIALTEEQAEMLHGGGVLFAPSYVEFDNSLTSDGISEAIAVYQEIGLFQHLTNEQISQSTQQAMEESHQNLNDVLAHFPNVLLAFDLELANLEDPYVELTKGLSEISHGAFQPTNISDSYSQPKNGKVDYQFDFDNEHYQMELGYFDDWADEKFMKLIDKAVEDHHLKGKFYWLYEGGQGAIIIFLTETQLARLEEGHFVVF